MPKLNKSAFTLIELLIVIAIIGILSTLAIVALGNARAKARDAKRVADIKQISTALDLYYSDYGSYPAAITPGNSLVSPDGTKVYMSNIPSNPTPRNDTGCGNNEYTYSATPDNTNFTLNYCISNPVGANSAGVNTVSSSGPNTAPGLVAWWKFDEGSGTTAIDSSGGGNNETLTNGPTWQDASNCRIGTCLSFDGINDYTSATVSDALNMGTNSWTMMAWIKTTSTGSFILGGGNVGLWQFYLSGGGNLVGYINDGVGALSFTSSSTVNNGAWRHVAAVFNRSGNGQAYVDGLANGTPVNISSIGNVNVNTFFVSRHPFASSAFINGLIDDVRVYNRVLSAAEILAIYNATK